MAVPLIKCDFCGADCSRHWEVWLGRLGCDDGKAGAQGAVVKLGTEQRGAQALGGDPISVGRGDAFDKAVHAQATQIVGNSACGVLAWLVPEQRSKMFPDVLVGERALDKEEQDQDVEQGLNARIGEAQGGSALIVDGDRSLHLLEGCLADEAVVSDALNVEQTSVGCEADGAQFGEIFDASADPEVAGIVDRGFGSKCLSLLVLLLDPAFLVVDVQRRGDALGDDARAEATGCATGDLAAEHQADLAGAADIEVLADHFLEEDAPGDRLVEHLDEGELGLQDGQLVAIACGAAARGETDVAGGGAICAATDRSWRPRDCRKSAAPA
jgi:hypothetical protein